MDISELIHSLEDHACKFPLESKYSQETILWIHEYGEFAFIKQNLAWHITASLLIVNKEKTKVLLMFHKKLQMWLQFWGHADGEIDTKNVAIREFHEESWIEIEPFIFPWIFDIHIHDIPEHKLTPAHRHFDILYLGIIPENTPFVCQESEVDDICWFDIEGIEKYIAEERMLDMMKKIKHIL